MKSLIKSAVTTVLFLLALPVFAHGSAEAKHGGIVQTSHDIVFELVRGESNISVYVEDHGAPVDTSKIKGSVMVLADGQKQDVALVHESGNKMTAEVSIPDGAKVLLKIDNGHDHGLTVRYSF